MKIVAVHSDPETFGILKEGLGHDFELIEAPVTEDNPEAAMGPCDVIMLDFLVPDPVETLHLIRTIEKDAPVLLLLPTKYQFKVVSNLFHYGIKDCILRPFGPEDINTAVRKAMGLPESGPVAASEAPSSEEPAPAAGAAASDAPKDAPAKRAKPAPGKDSRIKELAEYLLDESNLPTLPVTAMRVMRMCRNEDVTTEQLDKLISGDQSLADQLMRTANSALYRRIMPVESLHDAIVRVGLTHVSNLTVGLSAKGLHKIPTPRSKTLWNHSRGIACASQVIAKRYRLQEDAYVAGLLHNVGMTLLNNLDAKRYQKCLDLQAEGTSFRQAEREIFGVDHTQLGSALAKKWDINPHFREAIRAYPAVWKAKNLSEEGNRLASSIKLANVIMQTPIFQETEIELTEEEREAVEIRLFKHPVVKHLGLASGDVGKILDKLEDLFDEDDGEG
tara:strand:- start:142 stop:1482 length:1341 start_codon:yes stop_codon:yes gene_type:complete